MLYPLLRAGLAGADDTPPVLPGSVSFAAPAAASKGAEAGYLPGGVEVSPSGEATYDVPLDVPAGPGGMHPALSLRYGSRSGNGPLGMGWQVSGLSSVTRCGQSVASEGRRTGVHYKNSDSSTGDGDRFCLDGQKLVAVSGTYGAPGTEYRTENESFTKIVSRGGDASSGPEWFEVWTKDGRKQEYRAKTAPRLSANGDGLSVAGGGEVRFAYPISKDVDRSGNAVEYTWDVRQHDIVGEVGTNSPDARGVELLIDRIGYSTMNAAGDRRRREVRFVYEDRDKEDRSVAYAAGVRYEVTQRLAEIQMWGPNPISSSMVWKYSLGYDLGASKRTRLLKVTKCGHSGGCLLARTFSYSNQGPGDFSKSKTIEEDFQLERTNYDWGYWSVTGKNLTPVRAGDFNGDGADDLLYNFGQERGAKVALSKAVVNAGPGGDALVPLDEKVDGGWDMSRSPLPQARVLDAESDGQADIYINSTDKLENGDPNRHGSLLHFNATDKNWYGDSQPGFGGGDDFADLNGDGRIDVVHAEHVAGSNDPVAYSYAFNRGDGRGWDGKQNSGLSVREGTTSMVDVDGDGRAEVVSGYTPQDMTGPVGAGTPPRNGTVFGLRDDGTPYTESFNRDRYPMRSVYPNSRLPVREQVEYGDFNSDGLQDAL
nr:SpvB/TcaC N-terminal domain-containing protein [Streptomyces chartreusis]